LTIFKGWLSSYDHSEIIEGGNIVFEMGPEPNIEWGNNYKDAPPSMSIIN